MLSGCLQFKVINVHINFMQDDLQKRVQDTLVKRNLEELYNALKLKLPSSIKMQVSVFLLIWIYIQTYSMCSILGVMHLPLAMHTVEHI